jgi:hypothetical protein
MPKPVKKAAKFKTPPKPKRPPDPSRAASSIFEEHMERIRGTDAADQPIVDPLTIIREHMAKIGAKGGKVSGAKRMEMPKKQRKDIAKKAAAARWGKKT